MVAGSLVLHFFIAKTDETGILLSALFDLPAGSEARENGRDAHGTLRREDCPHRS
jgi:hypothetical protein